MISAKELMMSRGQRKQSRTRAQIDIGHAYGSMREWFYAWACCRRRCQAKVSTKDGTQHKGMLIGVSGVLLYVNGQLVIGEGGKRKGVMTIHGVSPTAHQHA